ncbi:hypothetical protein D3C71_1418270 [compost metagenome]
MKIPVRKLAPRPAIPKPNSRPMTIVDGMPGASRRYGSMKVNAAKWAVTANAVAM